MRENPLVSMFFRGAERCFLTRASLGLRRALLCCLVALMMGLVACGTETIHTSDPDVCIQCALEDAFSNFLENNWPGNQDGGATTGPDPYADVGSWNPDAGGDAVVAPPPGDLHISLEFDDPKLSGLATIAPVVQGKGQILGVEFYVDSIRLDTDLIAPYTFVVNTSQWLDGPHEIAVTTADSAGNVAEASADVVFDNTPPVFSSVTPAEGEGVFIEDGPLKMAVTSDDPDNLVLVEMRANGLLVGSFTSPPFEASIPFESLFISADDLPANVYVQFVAHDVLGQTTESTYTVTVHERILWTFPTLGEIRAEPALLPNGDIVIGNAITDAGGSSLPSKIYGVTPEGDEAWSTDVQAAINWAAVYSVESNLLYVGGDDGLLYSLYTSGGVATSKDLQQVLGGKVRVVGNYIYTVSYNGVLWVLNANNLDVVWTHTLPSNVLAVPAVGTDGTVYVPCFDGRLYAVTQSGVAWSKETGGEVRSSPVIDEDGTIYFGANDGYVYAQASDGSDLWSTEVAGLLQSELLIGQDGAVYVASSSKYLSRLDPISGTELWATKVGGMTLSAPRQGSDGTLYGGTTGGDVYAVAPEDGELLWSVQVSPEGKEIRGTVLVTPTRLYVGSVDRNLYALTLAAPQSTANEE